MKSERRTEILAAAERCFALHGVAGTTLEKVAGEAGLARALIRHNVGNRDQLIAATIEAFVARSMAEIASLGPLLPAENPLETLVDWLFDPAEIDPHLVRVSEALMVAASNNAAIAGIMRDWLAAILSEMETIISARSPGGEPATVKAVAAGLMGIYFNVESMSVLGGVSDLTEPSRAAALMLVRQL